MLGLSSCKTTRIATTSAVRPINSGKLFRNIEASAFDYKYLSIKRINCQFDNGKVRTSFKASIQAEKDKRIILLLSKLNIPVGRLWLTPDSVKYINYLENTYFLDDYSYLSSVMDMDLDFETIHAIVSNNVLSIWDEKSEKDNRYYDTKIDSGMYVLESVTKPKERKANQKSSERRQARKSQKIITDTPVRQSVSIDPETFKLRKIRMEDVLNSRNLNIDFSDFTKVGKQLYPGEIFLHFSSPESNMEMRIRMANFSTEKENEIRFKVPEKFTRINSN
ncbi:MAG: hypothetical protein C0397_00435 [Odoribacter sp.]|nr:hypothetical protein [Odoribacter sp.]